MPYIDPQFERGYNPDAADEGSFVELDMSTLTEYPSSGYGKTARLVYVVGDISRDQTSNGILVKKALTDHSGTISAGGTTQLALSANTLRNYLFIQNISDTDMWFNTTSATPSGAGAIRIVAGEKYENPSHFCLTDALYVYCTVTGKGFTIKEA